MASHWGEIDSELQDNSSQVPFSYAPEYQDNRIVKLRLNRRKVDSESQDNGGQVLLSYTAEDEAKIWWNHPEIGEILTLDQLTIAATHCSPMGLNAEVKI